MKRWQVARGAGAAVAVWLCASGMAGPMAHAHGPSQVSRASSVALGVSVAAPVALVGSMLVAGAQLVVVSVQASAEGTVWVLERASDGARLSVTVAGEASVAVGTGLSVVVVSTGVVLTVAGQAICFIPNKVGASLLHHEAVTR